MTEETSARIGAIAARGWRDPGSLTHEEIASVCASAVTQRPDHVVTAIEVDTEAVREVIDEAVVQVSIGSDLARKAAKVIRSLQTLGRFADHVVFEQGQPDIVASEVVRQLEAL